MDKNVIESGSATLLESLHRQATHINITPDQDVKPLLVLGETCAGKTRLKEVYIARNLTDMEGK